MVKNLPTRQKTRVWFQGQEDLLGKEMAAHSSILAQKISWTGRLQSVGSQRIRHDWPTFNFTRSFTLFSFSACILTLKEINPEYSLERLMLKLKLQYFADSLEKTHAGKNWSQEEEGMTEDEMVGWYHWFNGHEFEKALGDSRGQGSLACCSPWGHKGLVGHDWAIE